MSLARCVTYHTTTGMKDDAIDANVFEDGLEDYFTHVWKNPQNMPESIKGALNSSKLQTYFKYGQHRKIAGFLEGIAQNKEPLLDPAEVVPHYNFALDKAIAQLPPGYRTVFTLHDIEGHEHEEIARMLGCSVGTSKSQLHKARMKLRGLLRQQNKPR